MQARTQLFERRPAPRDYKPGIDAAYAKGVSMAKIAEEILTLKKNKEGTYSKQ